jgi:hypothetical protein
MRLLNFRFFALHYLNDWCCDDSRFVTGVSPEQDAATRLESLWEAAKYYKVTRTLPTLDGEERLAGALQAIDAVPVPITEATVDQAVCELAARFQELYGRYAVSAASKLLWIRHRWPIVILDDRASQFLWANGGTFRQGDYPGYCVEWRSQFARHEQAIRRACGELVGVKCFSLAGEMPDADLEQLVSSPWFRERVFDKFLWWNSGTTA